MKRPTEAAAAPPWRSRITRTAEVDPGVLLPHPKNWRRHPKRQRKALEGALNEHGWVTGVIVNERTGRLLDGHARVEAARDRGVPTVPVIYVDVEESEEASILASLDTIASMAEVDRPALDALLAEVSVADEALTELFQQMATKSGGGEGDTSPQLGGLEYRVVVDVQDEQAQVRLIARLESEGMKCKPLIS